MVAKAFREKRNISTKNADWRDTPMKKLSKIVALLLAGAMAMAVSYTHLDVYKRQINNLSLMFCVGIAAALAKKNKQQAAIILSLIHISGFSTTGQKKVEKSTAFRNREAVLFAWEAGAPERFFAAKLTRKPVFQRTYVNKLRISKNCKFF